MAGYVYIENDQITEIHYFLPVSWKNISNFNVLSDEDLVSFGWYPIIDAYQDYDTTQYQVSDTQISYQNGQATRSYVLIPTTNVSINETVSPNTSNNN